MDNNVERLLIRIKTSDDGGDFIDYLKELSVDNYNAWKSANSEMGDVHKGYALCVDNLIKAFDDCGSKGNKPFVPNIN